MLVEWASDQETQKKREKEQKRGSLPFHKSTIGGVLTTLPHEPHGRKRQKRGRGKELGLVVDGDGGPMTATVHLQDAEVELGRLEGRERAVERERDGIEN